MRCTQTSWTSASLDRSHLVGCFVTLRRRNTLKSVSCFVNLSTVKLSSTWTFPPRWINIFRQEDPDREEIHRKYKSEDQQTEHQRAWSIRQARERTPAAHKLTDKADLPIEVPREVQSEAACNATARECYNRWGRRAVPEPSEPGSQTIAEASRYNHILISERGDGCENERSTHYWRPEDSR